MSYGRLNAYQRVATKADTPAARLDGIFERVLIECRRAVEYIRTRDIGGKARALDRSIELIGELQAALDYTVAPELCRQLNRLYMYVQDRIAYANLRLDPRAVDEAARILTELRGAFADAASAASVGRER